MIIIGKKINYEKKLNPIYIKSVHANQIYVKDYAEKVGKQVKCKIGKKWVELKQLNTREAVLNDSLFLRFMNSSITRKSGDECRDFIVVKFKYNADYQVDGVEGKVDVHELRNQFYKEGITYTFEKKNKQGEVVERDSIHYKMLMRSTGKAKQGECVFIRDNLFHKAINFLTMGLYDLMDKQSQEDPEKVFRLVELSAYQTLTTATAVGYIPIPFENILIIEDAETYTDKMNAEIVSLENVVYQGKSEFVLDFESPNLETIINKKGYTFDEEKAKGNECLVLIEKSKDALKENRIRVNGKYPGYQTTPEEIVRKECRVDRVTDAEIKNVLWDGMGLIDESIFPEDMNGFIYCRSHFFKSCLFRGNIQDFFRDYCTEHGIDYDDYTVEKVDMFHRKLKLSDIKVIITDKSLKWTKFIDMMGGAEKKAYKFYRRYMKEHGDYFSIVKTAHSSKWDDLQLMAYQMNNSLPTTDRDILGRITKCAVDMCNGLKCSDEEYLKYLDIRKDNFNINELLIDLVKWNPDFVKTEFFRKKKSKDISKLKAEFKEGRLPQVGDNLTIMDNPIALLLRVFGKEIEIPSDEGCFELVGDGVQCYAPRFKEGETLAAFRSPHNSPNNIIHLYNVYPEKLKTYFPNVGQNVIVFNAIKTDTQARLSGHDCDSDFVYVTNHKDLADLAKKAYIEYPTIINAVDDSGTSNYHFALEEYAKMDNQIADAQAAIGTSTDIAQLALSYYYDGEMQDDELRKCFVILSVIGQISIDLAKKNFDIDVMREIGRIRNLPCMQRKEIPLFFATTKKSRNDKEFDAEKYVVKSMECPMDIMAEIIEEEIIPYASRESHFSLYIFWNPDVLRKGNKKEVKKVINAAEDYNTFVKYLEVRKDKLEDSILFALKNRAVTRFLNKAKCELREETVMQLVMYAMKNTDVSTTILNFLYKYHKEKFMHCFVKNN